MVLIVLAAVAVCLLVAAALGLAAALFFIHATEPPRGEPSPGSRNE